MCPLPLLGDHRMSVLYALVSGMTAQIRHFPFALQFLSGKSDIVAGKVFYVSSAATGNGQGTKDAPYATVALADAACVDDRGDVICLLPGHAETVTAAVNLITKKGVTLQSLGEGADRGTFTFQS